MTLNVGAVSYLNARPLLGDLATDPRLCVVTMPPALVAGALLGGSVDVGLVPAVALLDDPSLTWLPGLAIAAEGPVASVFLHWRPDFFEKARRGEARLALDPHSRSSQALTRLLIEDKLGKDGVEGCRMEERNPDEALRGGDFDAILVIGDLALRMGRPAGWRTWDLAEEWTRVTGLPFVFAVWGLKRDLLAREPWLKERFRRALEVGRQSIRAEAEAWSEDHGCDPSQGRDYLERSIRYTLGPREEQGLELFLDRAAKIIQPGKNRCSI
ncbi:MAG TPA: hypothetical protein ENK43_07920 [Planctomycetes bacterium]|nr:hypothetical protein [Planctomycetota bacterium]